MQELNMQEVEAVSGAGLLGGVLGALSGLVNGAWGGGLTLAQQGGWIAGQDGSAGVLAPVTSLVGGVLGYPTGLVVGGLAGAVNGLISGFTNSGL
ncbi:hypothetical protein [Burkholderia singularis]|nr:hypothetical protein [Burkholderia singularis]SMF98830.1 hypothetical protein BSIN_2116 [Burkholderia singularis]